MFKSPSNLVEFDELYNWYVLQSTIGELASVSEKEVVARFFRTTMQKLLKVTQEASKAENFRKSKSMQVDDISGESSVSTARWVLCLDSAIVCHFVTHRKLTGMDELL